MFVSLGLGVLIAVILIAIVSFATGGGSNSSSNVTIVSPTQPTNALVGTSVQDFHLSGLTQGTVSAPYAAGHPTVLIFFASWCGPCQAEMPKVASYLAHHNLGAVRVVGVDTSDKRTNALTFVTKSGVTFPVAFDQSASVANGEFQLQGLPDTVFVNAKGVVTEVYQGAIPTSQLVSGISHLTHA